MLLCFAFVFGNHSFRPHNEIVYLWVMLLWIRSHSAPVELFCLSSNIKLIKKERLETVLILRHTKIRAPIDHWNECARCYRQQHINTSSLKIHNQVEPLPVGCLDWERGRLESIGASEGRQPLMIGLVSAQHVGPVSLTAACDSSLIEPLCAPLHPPSQCCKITLASMVWLL